MAALIRAKGFSTLAASALLLLLAAFASLSVAQVGESLNAEDRARRSLDARSRVWAVAVHASEAFRERWDPAAQEWLDFAAKESFGLPVEFVDLSSRVNLNGVNSFLLGESQLRATLTGAGTTAFQEYRDQKGPFSRVEAYADFFQKDGLSRLYSTWSVFNVNTVDELAAERIATLRTGSSAVGAALRDTLRRARLDKQIFDEARWKTTSALLDDRLEGVFGVEPELNVNTADPTVLDAILTYPALELRDAAVKANILLTGRQARRWTPETLAAALQVPKESRVLQYLGTRTTFLEGRISLGDRVFLVVWERLAGESAKPEIRLVSQGWEP